MFNISQKVAKVGRGVLTKDWVCDIVFSRNEARIVLREYYFEPLAIIIFSNRTSLTGGFRFV